MHFLRLKLNHPSLLGTLITIMIDITYSQRAKKQNQERKKGISIEQKQLLDETKKQDVAVYIHICTNIY